jgi:hypothetical protein
MVVYLHPATVYTYTMKIMTKTVSMHSHISLFPGLFFWLNDVGLSSEILKTCGFLRSTVLMMFCIMALVSVALKQSTLAGSKEEDRLPSVAKALRKSLPLQKRLKTK